jgi:hypothetical protein
MDKYKEVLGEASLAACFCWRIERCSIVGEPRACCSLPSDGVRPVAMADLGEGRARSPPVRSTLWPRWQAASEVRWQRNLSGGSRLVGWQWGRWGSIRLSLESLSGATKGAGTPSAGKVVAVWWRWRGGAAQEPGARRRVVQGGTVEGADGWSEDTTKNTEYEVREGGDHKMKIHM